LERNEERRGDRPRTAADAAPPSAPVPHMTDAPPASPAPARRARATRIPIAVGEEDTTPRRRSAFAAPFLSAEDPAVELDSAELLPDFAPPQPPEELAAQMWKDTGGSEVAPSLPV